MEIFQSGAHDDLGIEIVAASPERVAIRVPFKPELARSIENMILKFRFNATVSTKALCF
jgi:acyl-coenzyme A thioesterase PaaI-like protein